MNVSFSQRYGYKTIKDVIQIDSINRELKTGLWNVLTINYWNRLLSYDRIENDMFLYELVHIIWTDFFKNPIDEIDDYWSESLNFIKKFFFEDGEWFEIYDFLEFIAKNTAFEDVLDSFISECNVIMERELSGFRFINRVIVRITSEIEISEIETAVNNSSLGSQHLSTALELLSNKSNPDYRNSIKESICAVESISKQLAGQRKGELKNALYVLETKLGFQLHGALKEGFLKIYGYTSDDSGIRHGLTEEGNLDFEDAKFMLVACSAFVNYLVLKSEKAGIEL